MDHRPIRIVIADDHPIFREGFQFMIHKYREEIELLGEAENGAQLVELAGKLNPDIIVTDIKMPVMDGVQATRIVQKKFPAVKTIALSMYDDDFSILEMLDAGARGYLLKQANKEELVNAIKAVNHGGNYYSNTASKKMIALIATHSMHKATSRHHGLSIKETAIIKRICRQQTSREIGIALNLSVRTVEEYRRGIQDKTEARNAVGIAIFALANGIVNMQDVYANGLAAFT